MALTTTMDQESECFRVLTASNHFEILELATASTEPDVVRKQYRRIALRVHPDKNQSPDAAQAFKAISLAYDCLCDESTQQDYLDDLTHSRGNAEKSKGRHGTSREQKSDRSHYASSNCKWWEHKSWSEVENEIKRQEEVWKRQMAREAAEYQLRKEKKSAYQKRRHVRVHRKLAPLYAKYGLMDDFTEKNDEFRRDAKEATAATYAHQHSDDMIRQKTPSTDEHASSGRSSACCGGSTTGEQPLLALTSASQCHEHTPASPSAAGRNPAVGADQIKGADALQRTVCDTNSQSGPMICTLCNRKFRDQNHLQEHVRFSQLHQSNLDKYIEQAHGKT